MRTPWNDWYGSLTSIFPLPYTVLSFLIDANRLKSTAETDLFSSLAGCLHLQCCHSFYMHLQMKKLFPQLGPL